MNKKNNRNEHSPIFRVLYKKINAIKELENEYWQGLNKNKNKISKIDSTYEENFKKIFPEQSSIIYACFDGVVLIRTSEYLEKGDVEVKYFNCYLSEVLKNLMIPY